VGAMAISANSFDLKMNKELHFIFLEHSKKFPTKNTKQILSLAEMNEEGT
jgi:hypothetical protein